MQHSHLLHSEDYHRDRAIRALSEQGVTDPVVASYNVQPSRYEGKSITVREAQILCKPVIVTAYPTAPSQIQDGVDGVIVPLDIEQCAKSIISFLKDIEKQAKIVNYLSEHDYGNESEINKIYQLAK